MKVREHLLVPGGDTRISVRAWIAIGTLGTVVAAALLTGAREPDLVPDAIHLLRGETGTEAMLSQAAHRAFGVDMHFRCATAPATLMGGEGVVGQDYDYLVGSFPLARLSNEICQRAAGVGALRGTLLGSELRKTAEDVFDIVHETDHYRFNLRNEGLVDCHATQDVAAFSEALGARPAIAAQLQDEATTMYSDWVPPNYICPTDSLILGG